MIKEKLEQTYFYCVLLKKSERKIFADMYIFFRYFLVYKENFSDFQLGDSKWTGLKTKNIFGHWLIFVETLLNLNMNLLLLT